ncbi:MAG: D-glycerate dehydrogenase [Halioglobus sp.]|nr:D-glycerate dehydrogenase [Halioglobus sp.]
MKQPVLVLSRPLPGAMVETILNQVTVRTYDQGEDLSVFDGAAVYATTSLDRVDAGLIEQLPDSVKLIANAGVGVDGIDLQAAYARDIAVSNTPVVAEDTADLTWALILAASRRLYRTERLLRSGDWNGFVSPDYFGQRVHGKNLGIVGLGAIGEAVARRAVGFNMSVCYHGPRRKPEVEAAYNLVFCKSLKDLLMTADVISLHCPLLPATRHLINGETLSWVKPGAVMVNAGRGALIEEEALVSALQGGGLGAAGLDVFEFEPRVNEILRNLDNVTLLPHIGSATGECRQDMVLRLLQNVTHFFQYGVPCDVA